MAWNWELPDWPHFTWDERVLAAAEQQFLLGSGVYIGAVKLLHPGERDQFIVEMMSSEALTTSEIEGEILDRASVQSSIGRQLGITADARHVPPAEQGIADMMVGLYRRFGEPLSDHMLFDWHAMLLVGRRSIRDIGRYRTGSDAMEIVSRNLHKPKVHFQAPPSERIQAEMATFLDWFNDTAPSGSKPLPALARAGAAHLYFESIHPFEDGNGRIGRAIAEKALAESVGQPVLTGLAAGILSNRKSYYEALEAASRGNEITAWLDWFARIAIESQGRTLRLIEFVIAKTHLLDRLRGQLNERQEKALLRVFKEAPDGFEGGLSASNYSSITHAAPATATRDLADLVAKGALVRTGERKHARYYLAMEGGKPDGGE